ncbi:MAG: excinuclease ABC subunit A, partial [Lentisphaeria bacterium]|nr:excinuclease ABC subunit A [Lentisphaeria bacterium]
MSKEIIIEGARGNNLKGVSVRIPLNRMTVVTGVSGSGKSSLAFDTVYAEGQRRYVETFSAYARQFLDRMDKPSVDRIEGIPPAIAINQTNPVRTSRSTVGTMTELNDYLKLLYARLGRLYCGGCGEPVEGDTPVSVVAKLVEQFGADSCREVIVTFSVRLPEGMDEEEVRGFLELRGYRRTLGVTNGVLEVIHSRVRLSADRRGRLAEALEQAFSEGRGQLAVRPLGDDGAFGPPLRFSSQRHCPDCDLRYSDPTPSMFSFNSPVGACDTCRGFGRVIGVDYELVVPDASLTLAEGAVKIWQSKS